MAATFTSSIVCALRGTSRAQPSRASVQHAVLQTPHRIAAAQLRSARSASRMQQQRCLSRSAGVTVTNEVSIAERKEELKKCKKEIEDLLRNSNCNPILVRLAWHDSGSYDKTIAEWPQRGGANGSIRFYPEIQHGANAGLVDALELLKSIADSHKGVSYADLLQLASATAIELGGGPKIPLRFGRKDTMEDKECAPEGRLPAAAGPFPDKAATPQEHLRNVFYRMGFNDQEIVALSGAHTLGRAKPSRSGFGKESTKYTKDGPGNPGGSSWTPEWLKFDNSYFHCVQSEDDPDLLVLPTDKAVFNDDKMRPFAEKYGQDQDVFFEDYKNAHLKLSELGSEWDVEPFTLDG